MERFPRSTVDVEGANCWNKFGSQYIPSFDDNNNKKFCYRNDYAYIIDYSFNLRSIFY